MPLGAQAVISLLILSAIAGNMADPPLRTMLISIQILPDIYITLHDGIVSSFMNAGSFHSNHGRLKKDFWVSEPRSTYGDDLAIGQLRALLNGRGSFGSF
ncbi:hypothetical protein SLA2020_172720 [Shorea laevis]